MSFRPWYFIFPLVLCSERMIGLGKFSGTLLRIDSLLGELITPFFTNTTVKVISCSLIIAAINFTRSPPIGFIKEFYQSKLLPEDLSGFETGVGIPLIFLTV